jgi:putative transposase
MAKIYFDDLMSVGIDIDKDVFHLVGFDRDGHRSHKGLNNRSEASHRHTRRREKIFGRFRSSRPAQMFLSAHDQTTALCRPKRHHLNATDDRRTRPNAHGLWVDHVGEIVA